MSNEILVEDNNAKWYNTKKFKISLAVTGVVVGAVICGVVVKKSGQRIGKDIEPAKDVLQALASVGSETIGNVGDKLEDVGEQLAK